MDKKYQKNEPAPSLKIFDEQPKDDEQLSARDKKIEMILERGFSTDNLGMKTDINEQQVIALTRALMFAEHYSMPLVERIATTLMTLSISKGRKGRKEWFDLGKSFANESDERGMINKLTGLE